jgi:REP element-mobilizing transposase RayT
MRCLTPIPCKPAPPRIGTPKSIISRPAHPAFGDSLGQMHRPPRLEFPNALYHVTSRGARKEAIFRDDVDRACLLGILASALLACDAQLFAYCLMGNHYHLVVRTCRPNLSAVMHRINSIYSARFNRRHGLCGSLFEARFRAFHVDRDGYLLQVCRYVDLNPVRAGLVESPGRWDWSSYRAHIGREAPPRWLATSEMHGMLLGLAPEHPVLAAEAGRRYADWVEAGRGAQLWKESLRRGRFLGDETFVERVMRQGV